MNGDITFERVGPDGVTCSHSCLDETVGVGKRVYSNGRFVCTDLAAPAKEGKGRSPYLPDGRTCLMSAEATENKE